MSFQILLDSGDCKTTSHIISFGAYTRRGIGAEERGDLLLPGAWRLSPSSSAHSKECSAQSKEDCDHVMACSGLSEDGASREIKKRGETIIFLVNVVKGEA